MVLRGERIAGDGVSVPFPLTEEEVRLAFIMPPLKIMRKRGHKKEGIHIMQAFFFIRFIVNYSFTTLAACIPRLPSVKS